MAVEGSGFHWRLSVCASVLLHDNPETEAARITRIDIQMYHTVGQKVSVTRH